MEESLGSSTLAPSDEGHVSLRSSQYEYERVPAVETIAIRTPPPPKTSQEQTNEAQDAGLLTRSRFHWSVLMPLDVLLALSPVFFFGKDFFHILSAVN